MEHTPAISGGLRPYVLTELLCIGMFLFKMMRKAGYKDKTAKKPTFMSYHETSITY